MVSDRETADLVKELNAQRQHVLDILDGLDDAALRRPVLPSGWSCLGLVRHLALDVERFWFRGVIASGQAVLDELADMPESAWTVAADASAHDIFDLYRREIDHSNAVLAATSLDAEPGCWPVGLFGDWRLDRVREIVLHVMVETAGHAGHLDIVRELIDGRQWLVLTG
jgi:hypothetical protein